MDETFPPHNGQKPPRYQIGQYVTAHGDVVSHVNISRVRSEDGGQYECAAENRAGEATHRARLNVYGEQEQKKIPGGRGGGKKCSR